MKIHIRFLHILIALSLVLLVILLVSLGEQGPMFVALVFGLSTLIFGIRSLVAYFMKYRYMVGGRSQLYIGIIGMDLGLLITGAARGSTFLILLYLLGIRAVTGGIDIARALESKKHEAPWVVKLVSGIISLATVVIGLIFFTNPETVVDIYAIGLIVSAAEHLITAFRRSKVVTIA